MAKDTFSGDKKDGVSFLHHPENRLKAALLPCVPKGIETYHLTLTTIVWSVLVILFSWLATFNRQWMWGVSAAIVAQYVTDLLDGAVGRQRNTGLIKWGFYMDHLMDYVFLCTMLIGYSLLIPNHLKYLMFFIIAVFCGFMVNSFLQFAATNKFRIAYWGIGPTEIRLAFIVINTIIIYVNQSTYIRAVPYILGIAIFALFVTAFNTQRQLWAVDMETKAEKEGLPVGREEDLQGLVIRHFLMSFIIASLAFLILVMRIGAPFHRTIAGVIYALSWIPIITAFTHKSWVHVKEKAWVRRFLPLVTAALLLAVGTWVIIALIPPVADTTRFSSQAIRESIAEDTETVLEIGVRMQERFNQSPDMKTALAQGDIKPLDAIASAFLQDQKTLSRIMETYQGYHVIDRHEEPSLHIQAFLVWFAAFAVQQNSVMTLAELGPTEQIRTILNNQDPIDNDTEVAMYNQLMRSVVAPNTLVKIGYSSTYMGLLEEDIDALSNPYVRDQQKQLVQIAEENIEEYQQKIERYPDIFLDALKTLTDPL